MDHETFFHLTDFDHFPVVSDFHNPDEARLNSSQQSINSLHLSASGGNALDSLISPTSTHSSSTSPSAAAVATGLPPSNSSSPVDQHQQVPFFSTNTNGGQDFGLSQQAAGGHPFGGATVGNYSLYTPSLFPQQPQPPSYQQIIYQQQAAPFGLQHQHHQQQQAPALFPRDTSLSPMQSFSPSLTSSDTALSMNDPNNNNNNGGGSMNPSNMHIGSAGMPPPAYLSTTAASSVGTSSPASSHLNDPSSATVSPTSMTLPPGSTTLVHRSSRTQHHRANSQTSITSPSREKRRQSAKANKQAQQLQQHEDDIDDDYGSDEDDQALPERTGPPRRREEVRKQRIESEQRRRDELRDGYRKLKDVLPVSNQKSSKVSLLDRATTHIQQLEMTQTHMIMKINELEQETNRLRNVNETLMLSAADQQRRVAVGGSLY